MKTSSCFVDSFQNIAFQAIPRIYSSYLKLLTIFKSLIIVSYIMETTILLIFVPIFLISMEKNLLIENLALRQQLAVGQSAVGVRPSQYTVFPHINPPKRPFLTLEPPFRYPKDPFKGKRGQVDNAC